MDNIIEARAEHYAELVVELEAKGNSAAAYDANSMAWGYKSAAAILREAINGNTDVLRQYDCY